MILTLLSGGLGNQMFQYAAARRLAVHRGTTVAVDVRMFDDAGHDRRPDGLAAHARSVRLFELQVAATVATPDQIAERTDRHAGLTLPHRAARLARRLSAGRLFRRPPSHVLERSFRFDPAVLDLPGDAYLQGFFQSWRYFADVAETIRADFQPRDPAVLPYARQYVADVRRAGGGRPVVSLHVRRGDLAHAAEVLRQPSLVYGGPVGLDYLRVAADRFGDGVTLLVFSDTAADLAWCRSALPAAGFAADRLRYAEGHTDVQDLFVMSACDGGHVIANSTFSWWAAWLDARPGVRVVAPRRWGSADSGMVTDDLIPPAWEQV